MLLAVSSLDIALASTVVAGVAAVASPWSAVAVMKLTLRGNTVQRTYADRREAYILILDDLYKGEFFVEDCLYDLTNNRAKAAIDIIKEFNTGLEESIDVEYKRAALISVLGPERVVKARRAFIDAWNAMIAPFNPPERFQGTDDDGTLRARAIEVLTVGLQALEDPAEKLRVAIRNDLAS